MTKSRLPESVINFRVLVLTPSRTVYVCRVCILPSSLHSTPCMRFILASPQSAGCIFCSVRSLYSLHKGNRLVLLFTYFSRQNPTDPGTPCFPQTPSLPRPGTPHPAPRTPHPGPVLSTKPGSATMLGNKTKEMYYLLLSLKIISFVLFPHKSHSQV